MTSTRILMIEAVSFLALMLCAGIGAGESPKTAEIEFNRDIRPILSKNCFVCHGADEGNRKAKLRLDIREEALKPRKTGKPAIDPGHPAASRVVKKMMAGEMPPEDSGNKLTSTQIETLKQWIQQGAPY